MENLLIAKKLLTLAHQLVLAKAHHSGCMVALYLPAKIANKLAEEDGEAPEDMHVTLAYLGDAKKYKGELKKKIEQIIESVSLMYPALTGVISGVGRFSNEDDDCIYASVDIPELSAMRQKLVELLTDIGVEVSDDNGFTPHCTIKYLGKKDEYDLDRIARMDVTFPELVWVYSDDRKDYKFKGSKS